MVTVTTPPRPQVGAVSAGENSCLERHHSSHEVPVEDLHFVGGVGFRAVVVPQVVAYVDIGTNGGSPAAFTGIDYPF